MKTRFLLAAVLAVVLAIPALAGKIERRGVVLSTTSGVVTCNVAILAGYLEAVRVDLIGGAGCTGTVEIAVVPSSTTAVVEPLLTKTNVTAGFTFKPGSLYTADLGTGGATNVGRRFVWEGQYRVLLYAAGVTGKVFGVEFVTETDLPL